MLEGPSSVFRRGGNLQVVRVDEIRHYAGFRYGMTQLNPYQHFACMLLNGHSTEDCVTAFVKFLRSFRPVCFGSLFQESRLFGKPLWIYPWNRNSANLRSKSIRSGWVSRAADVPDIMTHFADEGIPSKLICKESKWHNAAIQTIREHGYQPRRFSPIRLLQIERGGEAFWIAKDGNHRLASLCAMGAQKVEVLVEQKVDLNRRRPLPGVAVGFYTKDEVELLFNCYMTGLNSIDSSVAAANVV